MRFYHIPTSFTSKKNGVEHAHKQLDRCRAEAAEAIIPISQGSYKHTLKVKMCCSAVTSELGYHAKRLSISEIPLDSLPLFFFMHRVCVIGIWSSWWIKCRCASQWASVPRPRSCSATGVFMGLWINQECVCVCVFRGVCRSVPCLHPHTVATRLATCSGIREHADYTRHNGDTQTQICPWPTKDTHPCRQAADAQTHNCSTTVVRVITLIFSSFG